jgi:diacylglycerol O-acyltransferase / wax synthase
VQRLTAEDRVVLWADRSWPQDIGALLLLDGGPLLDRKGEVQIELVRTTIERRLHRVPRFRQVLHVPRRGLGWPLWVDAPSFRIEDHVRVLPVPAPGDEARLLEAVEQLRRRRLDRTRPLWELWLLPGLSNGRLGLFVRLHHVLADGLAGIASLAALLDSVPEVHSATPPGWVPPPSPTSWALFLDNIRRRAAELRRRATLFGRPAELLRDMRAAWPAVADLLLGQPGSRTSLDGIVGPHRSLALVRSDLDVVKQAARAHGATVNDVLLAVIAGGLRSLLRQRAEPTEGVSLPIYVPVSLRNRSQDRAEMGNLIGQLVVPLPIDIADPTGRLRWIAAETARRKATARPSVGAVFRSRVVGALLLKLIVRRRVNLTSADLPGPTTPLHFAGAQVHEVFPLVNLIGNVTLGVAAISYAGRFDLMLVADAETVPELDVLAAGIEADLRQLVAQSPVSEQLPDAPTDKAWATIPTSHLDLVSCPPVAALTTLLPSGRPQTTVVWCDFDGRCVRVNTMRGFQKERNLRRDPRVTLLCYDPKVTGRYLEIRGRVVTMSAEGAGAHLDQLASAYLGRPVSYFGDVVGAELAAVEEPVLCRIRPERVVARDWTAGGPR